MKTRKSNRLKYYNYSSSGLYYVTICIENRECVLGGVSEQGDAVLSETGIIIQDIILNTDKVYDDVNVKEYVIMPNHVHIIYVIGKEHSEEYVSNQNRLSKIISAFKNTSYKRTKYLFKWQRSYYDHVVRDEDDYLRIVEYIRNNPVNWAEDEYYKP